MSFTELTSFLQAQTEPHVLFDTQYRIIAVNQAFRKYCPPGDSVIGRLCYKVSNNYGMPCDRSGETYPLAKSQCFGKRNGFSTCTTRRTEKNTSVSN
jgi:hypothetical protein